MILLVLLALCVLLLCAALFVPVRYRVTVETKDEIQVRCQISWLLRVVRGQNRSAKEKEEKKKEKRLFI